MVVIRLHIELDHLHVPPFAQHTNVALPKPAGLYVRLDGD